MVIAWTVAISSSLETGTRTCCPGWPKTASNRFSLSSERTMTPTSPLKSASERQFRVTMTGWPTYHDVAGGIPSFVSILAFH